MTWIVAAIALCGNVLIILKSRWGFACWSVANVYLAAHNYLIGEYAQATLFAIYLGLAIWGFWTWRPEGKS